MIKYLFLPLLLCLPFLGFGQFEIFINDDACLSIENPSPHHFYYNHPDSNYAQEFHSQTYKRKNGFHFKPEHYIRINPFLFPTYGTENYKYRFWKNDILKLSDHFWCGNFGNERSYEFYLDLEYGRKNRLIKVDVRVPSDSNYIHCSNNFKSKWKYKYRRKKLKSIWKDDEIYTQFEYSKEGDFVGMINGTSPLKSVEIVDSINQVLKVNKKNPFLYSDLIAFTYMEFREDGLKKAFYQISMGRVSKITFIYDSSLRIKEITEMWLGDENYRQKAQFEYDSNSKIKNVSLLKYHANWPNKIYDKKAWTYILKENKVSQIEFRDWDILGGEEQSKYDLEVPSELIDMD